MHFKQINKTTWLCVADGPRDPITGKRKQVSRRGKTKKEAQQKVEAEISRLERLFSFDTKTTFVEFSEYWMGQYLLRGNKDNTNDNRKYCIKKLNEFLANQKVVSITTIELQNVLNTLFTNGTAQNTLRSIHNTAKMIFSYAKKVGLFEESPMDGVFVPKKQMTIEEASGQDITELYLETHELKEFLKLVDKSTNVIHKTLIYLIAFTGMRPGEAIGLKYSDIDLENKKITIYKTVYANGHKKSTYKFTPPKTRKSIREVDIDDIVVEKIKYLYEYREKRDWVISEYAFGDKNGEITTVKLLNQTVRRIGRRTSIKKRFRTYILRHTHISLLAEAGVDLNYIMDRVGHKDSNITRKIYLHVTSGMRKDAAEKMHKKFTQLLSNNEENYSAAEV